MIQCKYVVEEIWVVFDKVATFDADFGGSDLVVVRLESVFCDDYCELGWWTDIFLGG